MDPRPIIPETRIIADLVRESESAAPLPQPWDHLPPALPRLPKPILPLPTFRGPFSRRSHATRQSGAKPPPHDFIPVMSSFRSFLRPMNQKSERRTLRLQRESHSLESLKPNHHILSMGIRLISAAVLLQSRRSRQQSSSPCTHRKLEVTANVPPQSVRRAEMTSRRQVTPVAIRVVPFRSPLDLSWKK